MRDAPARLGAALLAILAVAAALRFATLGQQSLWLDEAYTARLVRMRLGDMLGAIGQSESTPPLYYLLAWAWARAFGFGEAGLRSLSAAAGTATVLVGFAAARRAAGPRAALAAAAVLAVHPLLVWFSQEARAYALATLLVAVSLWCWAHLRAGAGGRWWVAWAAAGAAAVLTHYFAAFAVGAQAAHLLWRGPDRRRAALAALAPAATLLALVPLALAQRGTGHAAYIAEGSLARRLLQVPKQLLVGYASPAQAVTAAAAAALVAVALLGLRREPAPRAGRAALGLALAVLAAPAALALLGADYLNGRNVIVALPALAVAIGAGLAVRRRGAWLAAALAAVLLAVTLLVAASPRFQRDDWRGAARALGRGVGPRVLVASPGFAALPLSQYLPGLSPLPATGAEVAEIDVVAIPPRPAGSGSAPPPRPGAPPPLPAGFAPAGQVLGARFTVVRYRAATPQLVQPGELGGLGLEPGAVAILLQRP